MKLEVTRTTRKVLGKDVDVGTVVETKGGGLYLKCMCWGTNTTFWLNLKTSRECSGQDQEALESSLLLVCDATLQIAITD